jgi:hypothetical protein
MKRQYKSILNEVAVKRDAVGQKEVGGYRLFEQNKAIPLAGPSKTAGLTDLRMWALR